MGMLTKVRALGADRAGAHAVGEVDSRGRRGQVLALELARLAHYCSRERPQITLKTLEFLIWRQVQTETRLSEHPSTFCDKNLKI